MDNQQNFIPRREFLRLTSLAAGGVLLSGLPSLAGARAPKGFVLQDKQLPKGWKSMIRDRGSRSVYRGNDLKYIGMPVGGICAGQVYLGGDGRLWLWDITNQIKLGTVPKRVEYRGATIDALGGANYVQPPEQVHPFAQGFALRVEDANGISERTFAAGGWSDIEFTGEYPIGFVRYRDSKSSVSVDLESFSPFIPLDADDSGLPAVVMRFTVKNESAARVKADLAGWLENAAGWRTAQPFEGVWRNRPASDAPRIDFLLEEPTRDTSNIRPPVLFEDWEKETYEGWTVTGTAFGPGPIEKAAMIRATGAVGGPGRKFAKSYNIRNGENNVQGDAHLGRLVSRPFTVGRRFVEFWIGGGDYPDKTCINLVVDGKVVRTATGRREDGLRLERWDVHELEGKQAHIEIVDDEPGFWGQIGIGQIEFVDFPSGLLKDKIDFGEMSLGILGSREGATLWEDVHGSEPAWMQRYAKPTRQKVGAVSQSLELDPGESRTVSFVVAWRFPNLVLNRLGKVGHYYASRFSTSAAVVSYIQKYYDRLYNATKAWHDTWYGSTLPYWLLDRVMGNTSTLASMTCVRFADGRFYGWEGIGCCDGTCGHVWQYAQTVGRLFPSLERSVREMVDYGTAFHPENGLIDFRGEYGFGYAADSQAGYILRTYREHQTSPDDRFLRRVYPRMKKALEYMIDQDANDNGVLEGRQHNTLDVDLYGPSSWFTSLYLAALRAGEQMATETGDRDFASRCRTLAERGTRQFAGLFWNGSYFVHRLKVDENLEAMRIGDGCAADQIMGQAWAAQLGLPRVVDAKRSKAALKSLYVNNFLTDVGPFRDEHKPGRWYAMPGEAGLLMCTFPKGNRSEILGPKPTWASMYFNECWTGSEYEAAAHMVAEGLVDEGLTVVRAIHDRHHPSRRNPWNEVECSDHYARCMAVYGVFVTLCGFEYHGPKGHIGFAPRLTPNRFQSAFTAAEGWGSYRQQIQATAMESRITLRHGLLRLRTVSLEAPARLVLDQVKLGDQRVPAALKREGSRVTVTLDRQVLLTEGKELVLLLKQA